MSFGNEPLGEDDSVQVADVGRGKDGIVDVDKANHSQLEKQTWINFTLNPSTLLQSCFEFFEECSWSLTKPVQTLT